MCPSGRAASPTGVGNVGIVATPAYRPDARVHPGGCRSPRRARAAAARPNALRRTQRRGPTIENATMSRRRVDLAAVVCEVPAAVESALGLSRACARHQKSCTDGRPRKIGLLFRAAPPGGLAAGTLGARLAADSVGRKVRLQQRCQIVHTIIVRIKQRLERRVPLGRRHGSLNVAQAE